PRALRHPEAEDHRPRPDRRRRLRGRPPRVSGFRFMPLSQDDAEVVAGWHYPEPYSFYDWTADPDDLQELLDPALRRDAYWAVRDDADELVGFFDCKPKEEGTVAIGLGLRP